MLLLVIGCTETGHRLSYSVAMVNDGKKTIRVDKLTLNSYDRPISTECWPGQRATDLSPTHVPNEAIKVSWIVKPTGERMETNLLINLPQAFITGENPTIVFHINPDQNKVNVTYEIQDKATGNVRTIE